MHGEADLVHSRRHLLTHAGGTEKLRGAGGVAGVIVIHARFRDDLDRGEGVDTVWAVDDADGDLGPGDKALNHDRFPVGER